MRSSDQALSYSKTNWEPAKVIIITQNRTREDLDMGCTHSPSQVRKANLLKLLNPFRKKCDLVYEGIQIQKLYKLVRIAKSII
jgi:hypothetical protein